MKRYKFSSHSVCKHGHQSKNRYNQLYYHHNLHNCCSKRQKTRSQRQSPTDCTHLVICLPLSLHFPVVSSIRLSSFHCCFHLIHHIFAQSLLPSAPTLFPRDTITISCRRLSFSFPNTVFTAYHLLEYLCHYVLLCLSSLFQCHPAGTKPTLLFLEGAQYTCTCWVSVARSIIFISVRFWLEEGLKKRTEWGRWRNKVRRLLCERKIKRF